MDVPQKDEPSLEQDGYEWIGPRFVPKEEYPDGLIRTGCNLGSGQYGAVDLYMTRERNGKWNELALKSGLMPQGRRDLHKEHFIYGKLKQWVQNNPDDPCVAAFDKIAKIYGMARVPEPGKDIPKTVLVMEKVSGRDGRDFIVELRERYARNEITHTQFMGVMQSLVDELLQITTLYRKAGFVHADMHICNFMIDRESGNLKLLDHGLAHSAGTPIKPGVGPFTSLEYGTNTEAKEQHDVFSIGASLLWGVEFDLATIRQKRVDQVVPGKASRFPNHGLTLPASGEKAFVIDEVSRMPRRRPGHVDAKTGIRTAFANAISEMMHRPSDQAPDARTARNLAFVKDRLLSDDEARELRRDLLKSRDVGQEPGKWSPREIPKRENLPREFAWIATDLDLLKREYELESAARGLKHHKRSPEMILQLLGTRDRLLNKLKGTHYTYPASSNPDARTKQYEEKRSSDRAESAISNLCRELDDLRNNIIEMASGTLDGLWEFKKDLPEELHAIAVEAFVLQQQQQHRLKDEITPALSSAQETKEPVESAPANALWNYHAALQAQQRCDQLINLVQYPSHPYPYLTTAGLDAINNKLLKTLDKIRAQTIGELSPANSVSQLQPTPIFNFPKDEFEVQHLVEQADALLDETNLTGKPSASATRRVQVIIDTLVKLVPLQKSLTERRDREQSQEVKDVLNDLVERLEKPRRKLDNRLKEYEATAAHAFAGTKKRIDKLFTDVFEPEKNVDMPHGGQSKPEEKVGKIATEADFAKAQNLLGWLKGTINLTGSQTPQGREIALKDFHELAPRMAAFVSRTRPILEELGLHSGFGRLKPMTKEESEDAAKEETIRELYMPNSLRVLRNKIKLDLQNTKEGTRFDSIMTKANLAQEFHDWLINESVKPAPGTAAHAKEPAISISIEDAKSKPLPDLPKSLPDMPVEWVTSMQKHMVKAFSLEKSMSKPLPDLPKPNTPGERVRSMKKRMVKIFRSENSTLEKMKPLLKPKSKQD